MKRGGPRTEVWHRKNDECIVGLKRAGKSVDEIARMLRTSKRTVREILRPYGLIKEYRKP